MLLISILPYALEIMIIIQVRLHRIFQLFRELETNLALSRLAVTLIRNLVIVILSTHVAGCLFYFISTQVQKVLHNVVLLKDSIAHCSPYLPT